MPTEIPESHFTAVVNALNQGRLIPFLGAGFNLCDRSDDYAWNPQQQDYLPSGRELAEHLARVSGCDSDDSGDLLRVSQYVALTEGSGPLYERLHSIFDHDYQLTRGHRFLASVPATLRRRGKEPGLLIVTTNYDDLLERAFREAGEPYDLVTYIADPEPLRGKFWHQPPEGAAAIIRNPNEYNALNIGRIPTIVKIHGTVTRNTQSPDSDSYVITEDHYIDYLARTDLAKLMPASIVARFQRSNFLFLGYGLRDWNLRVILYRIWGEQRLAYNSWAVQRGVGDLDRRHWMRRAVEILDLPLNTYIEALNRRFEQ